MMKQSVVIPTAGSAEFLKQTLASLLPMLKEAHLTDVVVVENGPQTGTEAIVGHFLRTIDSDIARRIRYVHEDVPGLLAGRHRGVFETDGDIVSFLDDDVIVSERLYSGLLAGFSDTSVQLVGGPARPIFLSLPPDWLVDFVEKNDDTGFMMTYMSLIDLRQERITNVEPNYIWGQNLHIRREVLYELGGFHPDIVPTEFARFGGDGETGLTMKFAKAGFRADYLDAVAIRHVIPSNRMTIDFVEKRSFYDGVSQAFTVLRESEMPIETPPGFESSKNARLALQRAHKKFWAKKKCDSQIQQVVQQKKREGRSFLEREYTSSDTVRSWVHRPDFMDYTFPDSSS
jgi:glycosyltransferase involved in cell wall biosynthesis